MTQERGFKFTPVKPKPALCDSIWRALRDNEKNLKAAQDRVEKFRASGNKEKLFEAKNQVDAYSWIVKQIREVYGI